MNFIKVWTELDDGKFKSLPAKIIKTNKNSFTIKYLSSTSKKTSSGKRVYAYEDETYEITEESITQRADSELSLGFEEVSSSRGNFVKFTFEEDDDEDEDYVPSSCEDDDDDDEISSSDASDEESDFYEDEEDGDDEDGDDENFSEYEDDDLE